MWSASEEGSYLRLIDCCILNSTLSSRVTKKNKKARASTAWIERASHLNGYLAHKKQPPLDKVSLYRGTSLIRTPPP